MLVRTAGESANENEHAKSSPKRPNGSRPRRLIQDEESEEEEDRLAGEEVVMQAAAASACIRPTPAYASLPAAMVTEAAPEEQEEEEEEEENVAVGKSALRGVGPMQTAINKTNAAASSSLSSSQMLSHSSINPLMYKERRRHLLQQLVDGGLESAEEHEGVESVARNLGSNRPDSQHGGGQEYAGSRSDSQHGGDDDDHSNLLGVNDRIIMAVSYRKKKLGCCYYSLLEKKIQMLEDVLETDQLEVLHLLLMQVKPDVIITSSRCDERMVQFIEHIIREEAELCGAGASDLTTLEIKPSSEFTISNGKARLLSVIESLNAAPSSSSVNNNRYFPDKTDNLLHLESIVSSDKTEMVGCCGALLNYISKLQIEQEDGDIRIGHALSSDYRVIGLNQFAVSQFMQINADTLSSLQIFEFGLHPRMHAKNNNQRGKEGLSLFGIMNQTKTRMGRSLLERWFLRPLLNVADINQRLDAVQTFATLDFHAAERLTTYLKHIKNIPIILTKLLTKLTHSEWQSLLKFSFYALKIRAEVRDSNLPNIPLLRSITATFSSNTLREAGFLINNVIDFEQCAKEGKLVVKDDVDEELDGLKRKYAGLGDFLNQTAHTISSLIESPHATSSLNVIYFPQLGYLIALPFTAEMRNQGLHLINGLDFMFSTATTVYYKNGHMYDLDVSLGDLHSIICDREIEIIQRLQDKLKPSIPLLVDICDLVAELDCILSLAASARKYNYKRPVLTEDDMIEIRGGRHPLQELCVEVFIPNDTKLRPNDQLDQNGVNGKAILLTGANYSGKSIFLKQTALIVFLAHLGSFVPADSATIGLTDKIFTRVQTRESVGRIQSAFMIDLNQAAAALRNATPRSLVLFDELGKGTVSSDGIGLFSSVIEFFSHLRLDSPRFIAATHFAEIISYKLLKSPAPQLYTMQINYDAHSDQKLTFLYRVVPGHSNCSYGCHCARLAEVKHSVVKRGEEISALMSIGEIILPLRDRVKGRFDNKVVLAIATAFESMKSPLELEILWKLLEQLE